MSTLGLKSGYMVKYDLSPWGFPRAHAISYRIYFSRPNTETIFNKNQPTYHQMNTVHIKHY